MAVSDRWHKSRPQPHEKKCKEHNLVPTKEHGIGDRWLVRWRDETGRQLKRSFALKVGKDPSRHADAFDAQIKSKPSTSPMTLTISDLAERWLTSISTWDASSLEKVHRDLRNRILPQLGDLTISQVEKDPDLIQEWVNDMVAEGLKYNSIRSYADHLSGMLTWALRREMIRRNPFSLRLIRLPRAERRVIVPYTSDQLRAIQAHLPEHYRAVVDIGAGLGLRIGEILGLSPDDIRDDEILIARQVKPLNGTKIFALPKRGKTRLVPLSRHMAKLLKELPTTPVTLPWGKPRGRPTTVRVFFTAPRTHIPSKDSLRRTWQEAMTKAGYRPIPFMDAFHKLRHTYVSRLIKAGYDIRSISAWVGHDDPSFTLRVYGHLMIGDSKRIMDDVPY